MFDKRFSKNFPQGINRDGTKEPVTKTDFITLISKASSKYGDKLVHMMELNDKNNLASITLEEARNYYFEYIKE